ncbi:hypothetical protein [Ralstonia phage RP13]|nr:hypothetical protein [Ralstonia phage RP13]BCG50289.1 hypothetical protein [Ralstonia phage RP13]
MSYTWSNWDICVMEDVTSYSCRPSRQYSKKDEEELKRLHAQYQRAKAQRNKVLMSQLEKKIQRLQ